MCPHIFIATERRKSSVQALLRHWWKPQVTAVSCVSQVLSDGILSLLVGGSQWPVNTFEGLDLFQGSEKWLLSR